ncbi:MAG TPA: aquaporin [Gemmatimonadales bacterium]|jgi:aquaporin Z|nr:aquaporin [Gemmatimonadales bacterium]
MRKYLTEFVGTLFFVMTIALIASRDEAMAPLVIGGALMVVVYMGGHISGAHYNPAVSLALCLRGKLARGDLLPYIVAQLAGAAAGALLACVVSDRTFAPAPAAGAGAMTVLLVEALYTSLLALVVLNAATSKGTQGNSFYGLAIGFTIVIAAWAGGPISGGAYNPAVATGTIVVNVLRGSGDFGHLWLYLVGPLAGGVIGAQIFRIQEPAG